jgi:hypothetical protein
LKGISNTVTFLFWSPWAHENLRFFLSQDNKEVSVRL